MAVGLAFAPAGVTVGEAPWSPTMITGLQAWFNADAITGLVDSDPLTTWNDTSGNGNHATQGTAGFKPLYKTNVVNTKPAIRFDGTDDVLTTTASLSYGTTMTALVVSRSTGGTYTDGQGLLNSDDGGTRIFQLRYGTSSSMWAFSFASGGAALDDTSATVTDWNVISHVRRTTNTEVYVNGDSAAATAVSGTQNTGSIALNVGVTFSTSIGFLTGDIAEILLYNSELSVENHDLVGEYLADKYGLTWGGI